MLSFFQTSTRNLLACEAALGVGHHIALSVVGTERMLERGFFRAKLAQEDLIKASTVPYSLIRATQFFEFIRTIADASTDGGKIRLPAALIQPMAALDVASALARVAVNAPANTTIDIGGPDKFGLDDLVRRYLAAHRDPREVITDPTARYFAVAVKERTLVPNEDAQRGETRFADWLAHDAQQISKASGQPA